MPITRRTSERKKSELCSDKNLKENAEVGQTARQSKLRALKKIEENVRKESPSSIVEDKNADAFDILCSSPMKQEVNFKPLSFWSKKVKDLEGKEKIRKKKFELFDLTDTEDSSSIEGKKRTKKKGRPCGRRQKITRKEANKIPFDFNARNFLKERIRKSKTSENNEGAIIRERIILQRLNNNCLGKEDKFSFNKINAFGLTSTPGRREKLNLVGGSTFDFLSPIKFCGRVSEFKSASENVEMNFEGTQVKESGQGCCSKNETCVTPRKTNIKGDSESVVTKDLKRVSENELTRNVSVVDNTSEVDSFPENIPINNCSAVTAESLFLSSNVNAEDSNIDLHQVLHEENEVNVTFLDLHEDEVQPEDDNSDFKIPECIMRECNNTDYYQNSDFELYVKDDWFNSLISLRVLLKILCINSDYQIDTTLSSPPSIASYKLSAHPKFSHNFSLPISADQTNGTILTDQSLDLGLHINISANKDSSAHSINASIVRNSFPYVRVRRPCNFFLNFRGSAKEEDFDFSRDESIKNCVKQDITLQVNPDVEDINDKIQYYINNSFKISSSAVKENFYSLPNSEINSICMIKNLSNEESTLVELSSLLWTEDQQTYMDNTTSDFTLVKNYKMRSNQYRSKKTETDLCGNSMELCFALGNDSSIVLSLEEGKEDEVDCSICKNKGEGHKCSQNEVLSEVRDNPANNESIKAKSELHNVTSFRVFDGVRRHKNQTGTKMFQENEPKPNSVTALDSPVVKSAPLESTIGTELTFNDECDFPLPIFESTTWQSPTTKKSDKYSSRKSEESEFDIERDSVVAQNKNEDLSELKINDVMSFQLKPGKKWARSAIILKKALNGTLFFGETCSPKKRGRRFQTLVEEVLSMQTDIQDQNTITSFHSVTAVTDMMSNLTVSTRNFGSRTVKVLEEAGKESSFQSIFRNSSTFENIHSTTKTEQEFSEEGLKKEDTQYFSARDLVLMRCNQEAPLPFNEYFNEKTLKNCKKIGEGTYGEVFMCSPNRVFKIIPIEGPDEINGEPQKKFDEIITEMVIAMELSNLRRAENYRTNGFSELKRCWCVVGEYPQYLLDLWNVFDCTGNGSENDSPEIFKSDQLYIILECANGGYDLESFVFNSAEQSHSIFIQVAFSLAVAERILEFEHRDMHWGNILINPTKEKYFKVIINGKEYKIPTRGVKVTIIDFTLSRISYDGCSIFNDLSVDPALFTSQGDYQFEIYRMMKEEVMNDWSVFRPRTNLFWLHYVLDKMSSVVRYKKPDAKIHKTNMLKFSELKSSILSYSNSEDFILNNDLL